MVRSSRLLAGSDVLAQCFDGRSHPGPRCARARRARPDPHPRSVVTVTDSDWSASTREEKHVVAVCRAAGRKVGVNCDARVHAVLSVGSICGRLMGWL